MEILCHISRPQDFVIYILKAESVMKEVSVFLLHENSQVNKSSVVHRLKIKVEMYRGKNLISHHIKGNI